MIRFACVVTCVLFVCAVADAQHPTKWTASSFTILDSSGTGPQDLSCLPIYSTNPVSPYQVFTPTDICFDGDGNYIQHSADHFATITVGPDATTNVNSNKVALGWGYCAAAFPAPAGAIATTGNWKPGDYFFRYHIVGTGESTGKYHSPPVPMFLARPGVPDVNYFDFDVLNEKDAVAGEYATARFVVRNFGELTFTGRAILEYSMDESMSAPAYVSELTIDSLLCGESRSLDLVFEVPDYQGVGTFAVRFESTSGPEHFGWFPYSECDQVKLVCKMQLAGTDGKFRIITPTEAPPEVPYGGVLVGRVDFKNTGDAFSLDSTKVQLEIKKKNSNYEVVDGGTFTIGKVPPKSGLQSVYFTAVVKHHWLDSDDVGKNRSLRVRIIEQGNDPTKNNNKSPYRKIKVMESVEILGPAGPVIQGQTYSLTVANPTGLQPIEWTVFSSTNYAAGLVDSVTGVASASHSIPSGGDGSVDFIAFPHLGPTTGVVNLVYEDSGGVLREVGMAFESVAAVDYLAVRYAALIKCEMLDIPADWILPGSAGFVSGDGRTFGAAAGSSRFDMRAVFNYSGELADAIVAPGTTSTYIEASTAPPPYATYCDEFCKFSLAAGSVAECTEASHGDFDVLHFPLHDPSVPGGLPHSSGLWLDADTGPGCLGPLAGHIDAEGWLIVKQDYYSDGQMGPLKFRVEMYHNGFPWHEMYIKWV